jgi:heterodisulfide reductase subunit B
MIAPAQKVYSYFPGCSLEAANKAYDISTRNTARVLGVEMVELEDWNCCGATAYLSIDERRCHVLATRNLALSEEQGRDLVTVCSGCYLVLHKANRRFQEDPALRSRVRSALAAGGLDYKGSVRVRHFLDVVVNDIGQEAIERHVVHRLDGLKVACYYGCQITRPFGEIDDPEFPVGMDRLMTWIGAQPVDFRLKTKCCGGLLMTTQGEIGLQMSGRLLQEARHAGADCISTACPLCQMNLEAYQGRISTHLGQDCRIPILYFTQILGSALGLSAKDLALGDSLTPVESVLTGRGVAS